MDSSLILSVSGLHVEMPLSKKPNLNCSDASISVCVCVLDKVLNLNTVE